MTNLKIKKKSNITINKINCNSVNYNVIGNVNGNNNIGNDNREEGTPNSNRDLGFIAYEKYDEKYNNKYDKGKGITCIIFNNKSIFLGNGNATDGNDNVIGTCEECFTNSLNPEQKQFLLANSGLGDTFKELCQFLQDNPNNNAESVTIINTLQANPSITSEQIMSIMDCLVGFGLIESVEIYENGIDDDGDGLIDCEDQIVWQSQFV